MPRSQRLLRRNLHLEKYLEANSAWFLLLRRGVHWPSNFKCQQHGKQRNPQHLKQSGPAWSAWCIACVLHRWEVSLSREEITFAMISHECRTTKLGTSTSALAIPGFCWGRLMGSWQSPAVSQHLQLGTGATHETHAVLTSQPERWYPWDMPRFWSSS